jgi:oligopeptide/dipeptide ABC transporter ATP-binding protein
MSTDTPLLRIDGLDVSVRDGGRALLRDASLQVRPGQIVGLVGESGSGKTTLCRAVAALLADGLEVTGGRIRLRDRDLTALRPSQVHRIRPGGVAMVFQDPARALNPVMPVGAQIREALRAAGRRDRRQAQEAAVGLLSSMGLEDAERRMHDYPHQLSGGQRQRVVMAIALAKDPALLVADEPTSAVDVSTQAQILDLLTDVAATRGVGILLVSHDFGVIGRCADEVVVMYAGHVLETGPAQQVLTGARHPYTRALVDSLPSLRTRRQRLPVIPSRLRATPAGGCPFYGRCPHALDPDCSTAYVHRVGADGGHTSACVRQQVLAP